ncbi:MAG: DUF2490 domain-containing protein, partial [Cyclobacteriaceae bacterium]|nr:DUF2490 domain-containing protein [Cyclobacteriaceae bacterium]
MKRILLFSLFTLISWTTFSQTQPTGLWLMYFGKNKINDTWSIHTEVQHRNYEIIPNLEQLLLRTGINYQYKPNLMITAGYGYIGNYDPLLENDKFLMDEHRVWQQFILKNTVSSVKIEHRYRIEQRWVNANYSNRLRYRLLITIPLTKKENSFYLNFYDEVFLNTKNIYFDRNRIYGA